MCILPATTWAPRGCLFTAAAASADALSPAVVASVAGHGAIGTVLQLMWERMGNVAALLKQGADVDKVAYNTTGAGVFTDGVAKHLGAGNGEGAVDVAGLLAKAPQLRSDGVCLMPEEDMHKYTTKAAAAWDAVQEAGEEPGEADGEEVREAV